ncbi:hypothetical protein CLOM_g22301 [Closterium sp. NIES-68]|nr:hypothetical protein CLOM_g22301 [Closterium sp. NIES-68]GJP64424.1 hypothetical protein CLOP_g21418 [Closterium sp. NIES-67]
MTQTVHLKVAMPCGGCSAAVKRVLEKMEGVQSFDISLEKQKVTVVGDVKPQDVFDKVAKTGKATSWWQD